MNTGAVDDFEARMGIGSPPFAAPRDQPLLQSAARAGIDLPSSCRNGSCRSCMRRLTHGRITYRIEWPGLLAEEKAQGWILPCVAYPLSDVVLEGESPAAAQSLPVG